MTLSETGTEQGEPVVWHFVDGRQLLRDEIAGAKPTAAALCGAVPASMWSEYHGDRITCPQCLSALAERHRLIAEAPQGLSPQQETEIDGLVEEYGFSRNDLEKEYAKSGRQRRREAASSMKWFLEEAERLSRPPATVTDAFWRHYNSNPFPPTSKQGKAWLKANQKFAFDGTFWTQRLDPMRSNSGKNVMDWGVSFRAEDGRTKAEPRMEPNRRNDPDRKWGLPE